MLSNCDIAELLSTDSSRIGKLLCEHERTTKTIVPRRANLHDVGRGVTLGAHYLLGSDTSKARNHTLSLVRRITVSKRSITT